MKNLFLVSLLFSFQSLAATWKINKDHSEILFQVPYLNVSELTGRFTDYDGTVDIEDNSASKINSLKIEIQTSSINTGHKMRDNHLQASDFLESRQYPTMKFESSKVTKKSATDYVAEGTLTIKKTSKPFNINFSVTDSVTDTWGYENKFVKYKSKVNRKDFDINWNKTLDADKFLVGDEIIFWGVFQIQPEKSLTPTSKHMIPDTSYIRDREAENRKGKEESGFSQKLRKLINGQ
jgi:polyisoprenoid-binding protein YceI